MKEFLKKYLYEIMILALIVITITSVCFIKGRVGAFAWVASLFVIGPLGILLSLLQVAVLVYKRIAKKKIRVIHLVVSLLMAFPTLILMGVVFIPYPDSADASEAVTLSIPIEGNTVLLGGKDYRTHAVWPSERYAYDIMVPPYDTGNPDLQSYGIYGKDVYAPIKGEVIEVHDGEDDITPNIEKFTSLRGNYIYIKIEQTGTYLIFAHLKKDSIQVKKGDIVEVGTLLAQVGNSGTTSEPHLHIQHQRNYPSDSVLLITDEGLPMIFE